MEFNRKNIKIIIGIISFTIVFAVICTHISSFFGIISTLLGIAAPFIIGGGAAFILNIFMKLFEEKLFKKIRFKKLKRITSVVLTLLLVILILLLVIRIVLPEIVSSVISIIKEIPAAADNLAKWFNFKLQSNEQFDTIYKKIYEQVEKITENVMNPSSDIMTSLMGALSSTFGFVSGTISGIASFFIGIVFAVYILLQKERLLRQCKQILYAFVKEKYADKVVEICSLSNRIFQKFITGQCTESLILGVMFFISMMIFRMPYALMVSMLIAVTSLVPIIGAFVGCAVGAILIFIDDPKKAIIFIIMFLVLQQIEGNLIYPHVVGNSVGLPSMWVLCAVTIGGKVMGVLGMLLFIPLSSVIYVLFRECVSNRLKLRKISPQKYNSGSFSANTLSTQNSVGSKNNKKAGK